MPKANDQTNTFDPAIDEIDWALHEIRQMVLVAIRAGEDATRRPEDEEELRCEALRPEAHRERAEMLMFSLFDIQKRIDVLSESIAQN